MEISQINILNNKINKMKNCDKFDGNSLRKIFYVTHAYYGHLTPPILRVVSSRL